MHAVRHANELTYRDVIAGIAAAHPGAFTLHSDGEPRNAPRRARRDAFPTRSATARLESRAGLALAAENSHAMLCGNPAMVDDTQKALEARGMRRHRRREPGHVTVETYW